MYDSTTRFALDNLAKQLKTGDAIGLRIAAEQVLRVTSPAAVEDREYFTVDLALPRDMRCGHRGPYGRVCSRRFQHVSPTHREAEISWTDEMAAGA